MKALVPLPLLCMYPPASITAFQMRNVPFYITTLALGAHRRPALRCVSSTLTAKSLSQSASKPVWRNSWDGPKREKGIYESCIHDLYSSMNLLPGVESDGGGRSTRHTPVHGPFTVNDELIRFLGNEIGLLCITRETNCSTQGVMQLLICDKITVYVLQ